MKLPDDVPALQALGSRAMSQITRWGTYHDLLFCDYILATAATRTLSGAEPRHVLKQCIAALLTLEAGTCRN